MKYKHCSVCLEDLTFTLASNCKRKDISRNALSAQLSIFYLVHKLLEIPLEECEKYIEKYGNPNDWVLLCPSCSFVLEEAETISKNIIQLQNDLESLKNKLAMQMRVKLEVDDESDSSGDELKNDTAAEEIRRYVCTYRVTEDDEFSPNSPDFHVVQVDADATEDFDFEDVDYSSDDARVESDPLENQNTFCISLTGKMLENTLRDGNFWKCPVCFRAYKQKKVCRDHIRKKHRPFLYHLDNKVPKGHKCEFGLCLPYKARADRPWLSTKVNLVECESTSKGLSEHLTNDLKQKFNAGQYDSDDDGTIEGSREHLDYSKEIKLDSTRRNEDVYVSAEGEELENFLKIKNTWLCPVCIRPYRERRTWREHIRRRHKPFLFHLDENLPEDHKCMVGLCLPKFKSATSFNKKTPGTKLPTSFEENSRMDNIEFEPLAKSRSRRTVATKRKSLELELEDMHDSTSIEEDPESDPELELEENDETYGGSVDKVEKETRESDPSDKELSVSTPKKAKLNNDEDESVDGSDLLTWKCHLCIKTIKIYETESTMLEHYRKKHHLHFPTVPKNNRNSVILAMTNVGVKKETNEKCPSDNESSVSKTKKSNLGSIKDELLYWKCHLCTKSYATRKSMLGHYRIIHQLIVSAYSMSTGENIDETEKEKANEGGENDGESSLFKKKDAKINIDKAELLKWKCDLCIKSYSTKKSLLGHFRIIHNLMLSNLPRSKRNEILALSKADKGKNETSESDSSDEELSASTPRKAKINHDEAELLKWKCHLCIKTYSTKKSLHDHFRIMHALKVSTLPKSKQRQILALTKVPLNKKKDDCSAPLSPDRVDNYVITYGEPPTSVIDRESEDLIWKCDLCNQCFQKKELMTNHFKNIHQSTNAIKYVTTVGKISSSSTELKSFDECQNEDDLKETAKGEVKTGNGFVNPQKTNMKNKSRYYFKRSTTYKRHEGSYNCQECNVRYKFISSLHKHMLMAHGASTDLMKEHPEIYSKPKNTYVQCRMCNAYCNIKGLPKHMLCKHGVEVSVAKVREDKTWAEVCKEREEMLQSEELSISETLPKEVIQFRKKERLKLQLHILAQKFHITNFPCENCSETFNSYKDWDHHNQSSHKTGWKCDTCGKVLAQALNLENHIRSAHHPDPASIATCPTCHQTFMKADVFNEHIRRNPNCFEDTIPCKECKLRYSSQEGLDIHVKIRHAKELPTPFRCSFCDKPYSFKIALKHHESTHLQSKDHICDKCGSAFYRADRLMSHIKSVHLNREPEGRKYPCTICGKHFFSSGGVRRHEKIHSTDNPFKCDVCGKCFKIRNYLTIHTWSHDPDRFQKYSSYRRKPGSNPRRKGKKSTTKKNDMLDDSSYDDDDESDY